MAHRYVFLSACERDLDALTRRNHRLLMHVVAEAIPAILLDPEGAGEKKRGVLAGSRAFNIRMNNVAYRLVYRISGEVVEFIAIGPHDDAYRDAERRA